MNRNEFIEPYTDMSTNIVRKERLILYCEQLDRSLFDNNLDAVVILHCNGEIVEVNETGKQLVDDMKGNGPFISSVFSFIKRENLSVFHNYFKKCIITKSAQSLDCSIKRCNGEYVQLHMKCVPIFIEDEVNGVYLIMRDISEKTRSMETIRYMTFHDQLTGLYNRRALLEDVSFHIEKAKETSHDLALLTMDIDRFKYINDTFGHIVGDQILIKVAERLMEFNTTNCHVYRQGGDEFNILLSNTNRQATSEFAQSILSHFAASFYLNSQEYYITPSIGISMYPYDGSNVEMLIKNSDEALFRVKERGKAHYQFYRTDMNMKLTNFIHLEANLRKAIQNKELLLYYQPQVKLKDHSYKSFEALIRWESPAFGIISPNEFIPLAEDTGLIIPIGNWVIDTACKQIKEWQCRFEKEIRIAVNISPKQFQQPNFVDIIKHAIEKFDITPALLEIEITEGALQDTKETISILRKLKNLGVIISVDDFGTGYSSLNYIKQFPIDVLKIDQSFVRDILENTKDAAITSTIIHLGRNLGMEVIAEGVENKEQAEFLMNENCQKAQGYYFSKPLPLEEVDRILSENKEWNSI